MYAGVTRPFQQGGHESVKGLAREISLIPRLPINAGKEKNSPVSGGTYFSEDICKGLLGRNRFVRDLSVEDPAS